MPLEKALKALAYQIDPECWRSYSGKPKLFKQRMDSRRTAAIAQAHREVEDTHKTIASDGEDLAKIEVLTGITEDAKEFLRNCYRERPGMVAASIGHTTSAEWERGRAARYSVDDLDRMRAAIRRNPKNGVPGSKFCDYKPAETTRQLEDILRTHMLNGTTPADLEKAADEAWAEIRVRRAMRDQERADAAEARAKNGDAAVDKAVASVEEARRRPTNITGITDEIMKEGTALLPFGEKLKLRIRIEAALRELLLKFKLS